jgi:DNA-binding IclR family transcriptional regulator
MSTVLLGILLDDQLVYIDKRESPGPIRIASDVGWRRSPHFGMLGVTLSWPTSMTERSPASLKSHP